MPARFIVAILSAALFVACVPAGQTEEGHKTPGATELILPDTAVPDDASYKRDRFPRDGYGRPWTHSLLGHKLPVFEGSFVDGDTFSSTDLEGNWTVIEVWGLWCHDSMNDAPYANALARALDQDPTLDFMSIHTPQKASRADKAFGKYQSVSAYFDKIGQSFPTVVDHDASIRGLLDVRWTPTYLLIAPDLSVQAFRTGLADTSDMPVKDFVRAITDIKASWQPEK